MTGPLASAIYRGAVMHARFRPVQHRLQHRVFALLLDLSELTEIERSTRLFRHNRFGLLSFHDRDHGSGDGTPLRGWIDRLLLPLGIRLDGGAIRVLCYPRVLGFVFNPISVWFCHRTDGALAAVVYEVHNTFGERHAYVLPVEGARAPGDPVVNEARKAFHVSPFLSMDCAYRFRITPPGQSVAVTIRETEAGEDTLVATFAGDRTPLTGRALLGAWAAHPLMTLKVVAAIHWHAFLLWRKGLRVYRLPKKTTGAPTAAATELRRLG